MIASQFLALTSIAISVILAFSDCLPLRSLLLYKHPWMWNFLCSAPSKSALSHSEAAAPHGVARPDKLLQMEPGGRSWAKLEWQRANMSQTSTVPIEVQYIFSNASQFVVRFGQG